MNQLIQRRILQLTGAFILAWSMTSGLLSSLPVLEPTGFAPSLIQAQVVSPTHLSLNGPSSGTINYSYPFLVSVEPFSSTTPLTYVWQLNQQPTLTQTGGLTQQQLFSWPMIGRQWLTVTAFNEAGLVSQSHHIDLRDVVIPPHALNLNGPSSGTINYSYPFLVSVEPFSSTTPLTYVWQLNQQPTLTQTGGLTQQQSFSWPMVGRQWLTVTAFNEAGLVSQSHHIDLRDAVIPPHALNLNGPSSGTINYSYPFLVSVEPFSSTTPLTYVWQATDFSEPLILTGPLSSRRNLAWSIAGAKIITVTASNEAGQVTATHRLTIYPAPTAPPTDLAISGPHTGTTGATYEFSASVTPLTASLPLTYFWEVDHQPAITQTGDLSQSQRFSWPMSGTHRLTVTAMNQAGVVSQTHSITLVEPTGMVSLTGVVINGPFQAVLGGEDFFKATILPPEASQPITYSWLPQPYREQNLPLVSYVWTMTGSQVITVVADNGFSQAIGTYQVMITEPRTILIPPTSTMTATVMPTPSPTTTVMGTPTSPPATTPTSTVTIVATPSETPAASPSPTDVPTVRPTDFPSPTSTPTPTATSSSPVVNVYLPVLLSSISLPTPNATPTVSPTATTTKTPTAIFTPTPTATVPVPPTHTPTTEPTPTPVVTPVSISNQYEQQIIELTNQERSKHGCAPLVQNELLMQAAKAHSQDMALKDFFSHTGLNGSSPGDRINKTGYRFITWAENIAAGYSNPQKVVEGWMKSEGHRRNILNCSLQEIGVGHYYLVNDKGEQNWHHYWTQLFAVPQ